MAIKRYFYSACQKCRERYLRSKSSKSKVLTFHQVNDNTSLWFDKTCSMTKKSFAALLSNLMVRGYRFGALSDLENKQQDGKRLFLTFDDAYVDVYTNCYPLLKKYNIPFAVFMTVDYLDKEAYLSTEMIKEMMHSGLCTVGSHTVSHQMLRYLDAAQVQREVAESKAKMETLFGTEIAYFAYPYGSYYACSKSNVDAVEKAGYRMAFSTINSALPRKTKRKLFLPRVNVNEKNYVIIAEEC